MTGTRGRVWFLTGTPGSGKTTLAHRLSAVYGRPVLSTGDIARRIDPEALARGDWADPDLFREAMRDEVDRISGGADAAYIVDGYPRTLAQFQEIPAHPDLLVFYLCCVPSEIAVDRLTRRGRSDDTPDIIKTRVERQTEDLESWVRREIPWGHHLNTAKRTPDFVFETVRRYLDGERKEIF